MPRTSGFYDYFYNMGETRIISLDGVKGNYKKHGCAVNNKKTTEYVIWSGMKYRCHNSNDKSYFKYGARGIKVCQRWLDRFENFIEDMGYRPSKQHSIDRIDNNGNYTPENCRWATIKEQNNNMKNTRFVTYLSKTQPLGIWCDELNLNYNLVNARLFKNWTIEEAFKIPNGVTRKTWNKKNVNSLI